MDISQFVRESHRDRHIRPERINSYENIADITTKALANIEPETVMVTSGGIRQYDGALRNIERGGTVLGKSRPSRKTVTNYTRCRTIRGPCRTGERRKGHVSRQHHTSQAYRHTCSFSIQEIQAGGQRAGYASIGQDPRSLARPAGMRGGPTPA